MEENQKVENLEETIEEKVETPENKSKNFSQDDVNKIVTQRVKKEQEKTSSLKQTYESQIAEMQTTLESYENVLKEQVQQTIKSLGFDDSVIELLADLPVLKQMEWLAKNQAKAQKKHIPQSPKGQSVDTKNNQPLNKFKI